MPQMSTRSTSWLRSQSARACPSTVRPSNAEYAAACSPLRKIASNGCGSRLGWNASPSVPPLYVGCGTEDHLFEATQRFLAAATAAGVDLTTDLRPGDHEWSLWDAMIQDVIAWLPLDGR